MKLRFFFGFVFLFTVILSCNVFALTANDQVTQAQLDSYPYWIEVIQPNYNSNQHTIIRSAGPIPVSCFKFCTDGSGKRVLYIDNSPYNFIYCDHWVHVADGWTNYIQPYNYFARGGDDDSRWYVSVIGGNYSVYDYTYIPPSPPSVQVSVGDITLTTSSGIEVRNINKIEGYAPINVFWTSQGSDYKNVEINAIYKGFAGIESTTGITQKTSSADTWSFVLSEPSTDYIYQVLVSDKSSPYIIYDGFTGNTRVYYFQFTSAVAPKVEIIGAENNSVLPTFPSIYVKKANSTKSYVVNVNGDNVYTFGSDISAQYHVDISRFKLGVNTVVVYDGLQMVKSLTFEVSPGGQETTTGGGIYYPPNGEDGPPDGYQPPPVSEGKPEPPSVDDPYSDWIYYYLEIIIYWLELPFKMLVNFLKDLKNNIVDGISIFIASYNGLFASTKSMFSFLPAQVWLVVSFGFSLSIFLWFFKARRG